MGSFLRSPNRILASLSATTYALLLPQLRTIELPNGQVLVGPGEELPLVYFPHSGVISSVVTLSDGNTIGVAMIGQHSAFGASAAMSNGISPVSGIVRFPGRASVLSCDALRTVADSSFALRDALTRDQLIQGMQAEQAVACNAAHKITARLARQLLLFRDLAGCDRLPLTQDILAQMLGVQRNSLSLAAIRLHRAGAICYSRGDLEIRDLERLIGYSCECYSTVKNQIRIIRHGTSSTPAEV